MQLEPLQSIVVLFAVLALVGAGVYLRWAKRPQYDTLPVETAELPPGTLHHVMDGRTAVARQLCGQAHCWNPTVMTYFDHSVAAREPWLAEADRQISNRSHHAV